MAKKKSVESRILEALQDFAEKLERGEPIKVTRIRRVQTPDGPMTLRCTRTVRFGRKEGA